MSRLIDADELKEWVENWLYKDRYYHNGRVGKTIPITELYDILEQIPIADVATAQQWIPVTERTLPNHNSVVVVCGEKGTWDFGTYRGLASTNINFWNWKKNTVKEVHWWMYKEDALPMPWEGGAEECH